MNSNSPGSPKKSSIAYPGSPSKLKKKIRLYHAPVTFYSLLLKQEERADFSEVLINPTTEECDEPTKEKRNSTSLAVEICDTDDTLTEIPESLTENFEEEAFEEDSFSSTSNDSDLDPGKYSNKQRNLLKP